MLLEVKEAKLYLRIDESYTEEDSIIESFILASEEYIRAGVTGYDLKIKNKYFKNKAKLVCNMLVQYFYDERYAIGDNNVRSTYVYPLKSLLAQMEYGDYPETEVEDV